MAVVVAAGAWLLWSGTAGAQGADEPPAGIETLVAPIVDPAGVPPDPAPPAQPNAPDAPPAAVELVAEVVRPVAAATAPVVEPALEPVARVAAPVVEPVAAAIAPVAEPVVEAAAPLVEPVAHAAAPVVEPALDVVAPITQPLVDPVEPVVRAVAPAPAEPTPLHGPVVGSDSLPRAEPTIVDSARTVPVSALPAPATPTHETAVQAPVVAPEADALPTLARVGSAPEPATSNPVPEAPPAGAPTAPVPVPVQGSGTAVPTFLAVIPDAAGAGRSGMLGSLDPDDDQLPSSVVARIVRLPG